MNNLVLTEAQEGANLAEWLDNPHIQAHGRWEHAKKEDFVKYIPETFRYKIETMEAEFTQYAIKHYLR